MLCHRTFVLCLLLSLLLHLSATSQGHTQVKTCRGNSLSTSPQHSDPLTSLDAHFRGCTHVFGDIIIQGLNLSHKSSFSFFQSVKEIYGSLVIIDSCLDYIFFTNLTAIRFWGHSPNPKPLIYIVGITGISHCPNNLLLPSLQLLSPQPNQSIPRPIIKLSNTASCYLQYKVNLSLFIPITQRNLFDIENSNCKTNLLNYPCHSSCGSGHCWGPLAEDCQLKHECLDGRNCFKFKDDLNSEVTNCPMLTAGGLCVSKCPANFTQQGNECLPDAINNKCVSLSSSICTTDNPLMFQFGNPCTEYHGNLTITDKCFQYQHYTYNNLRVHDMYKFLAHQLRHLTTIIGFVNVTFTFESTVTDLGFFSTLEKIFQPTSSLPTSLRHFSLVVSSPFIKYLGTSNLRQIDNGIKISSGDSFMGRFCMGYFPTNAAFVEGLVNVKQKPYLVKDNESNYFCDEIGECSILCDRRYGCWGRSAKDCVRCSKFRVGSECVSSCVDRPVDMCSEDCSENCKTCSQGRCIECLEGKLANGLCRPRCPLDNYMTDRGECKPCHRFCLDTVSRQGFPVCQGPEPHMHAQGCTFCFKVIPDQSMRCLNWTKTPLRPDCPAGYYYQIDSLREHDFPQNYSYKPYFKGRVLEKCLPCPPECNNTHKCGHGHKSSNKCPEKARLSCTPRMSALDFLRPCKSKEEKGKDVDTVEQNQTGIHVTEEPELPPIIRRPYYTDLFYKQSSNNHNNHISLTDENYASLLLLTMVGLMVFPALFIIIMSVKVVVSKLRKKRKFRRSIKTTTTAADFVVTEFVQRPGKSNYELMPMS